MRPLPSFLLLCASYGVTAIVHDFSTGKNGLDYCIAEADTTSDMTASTTMAPPPWKALHHVCQPPPGRLACASTTLCGMKDLNNAFDRPL